MTTIAATLNSQQIAAAKSAAGAITESAKAVVSDKRFVFLAAFDGTNNDRNAIHKSGGPLDTNVAQLERQVSAVWEADPTVSVRSKYYPGPGTGPLVLDSVVHLAGSSRPQEPKFDLQRIGS